MQQANALKVLSVICPTGIVGAGGAWFYNRRREYLADPVLQRALLHLRKDQRVTDFCGENIQPGWMITRTKPTTENFVKFELSVKGSAGKL
jgi:hypothetical protein